MAIHPTAIVEDGAQLGADVVIGPFCHVGPSVTLGDGVRLHSHVVVGGVTAIGARTEIFPFASIGLQPQDLKFSGEETRLTIGTDNTIREYVTMNPGTAHGAKETVIGNHGLFMACSHVAHDCVLGDHVILANSVAIAGHCTLGDYAIFGGLSAIHQFGRVGPHAFIGGASGIDGDVIPFGMAIGNRAALAGLNLIGLKRRGFERTTIRALREAYDAIFLSPEGTLHERAQAVADSAEDPHVSAVTDFILADKSRPLCLPAKAGV